jgi:hypothetical protein
MKHDDAHPHYLDISLPEEVQALITASGGTQGIWVFFCFFDQND